MNTANDRASSKSILLVYDSSDVGVEGLAEAIGRGLAESGSVRLQPVHDGPLAQRPDLLVVGGPADAGLSPTLRGFLDSLPKGGLRGVDAAAFGTYRGRRKLFSKPAAEQARGRLRAGGCQVIVEPASFKLDGDSRQTARTSRRDRDIAPAEWAEAWGRYVALRVKRGVDGSWPICEFKVGETGAELFLDSHFRLWLRIGDSSNTLEPWGDRRSCIDRSIVRTWERAHNGHTVRVVRERARWFAGFRPTHYRVLVDEELAAEGVLQLMSFRSRRND